MLGRGEWLAVLTVAFGLVACLAACVGVGTLAGPGWGWLCMAAVATLGMAASLVAFVGAGDE